MGQGRDPYLSGSWKVLCWLFFSFSFFKNNNGTFKKSRTTEKGPCLQVHIHIVPHCGSGLTAHSILAEFQTLKKPCKVTPGARVLFSWGPLEGSTWHRPRSPATPRPLGLQQFPLLSPNQSQEQEMLGNLFWSPQGTPSGTEPSPGRQEMTPQPIPAPLWEDGVSLPVLSPASQTPHWCPGSQARPTQDPPATPRGHSSRHKSDRYATSSTDPHQEQVGSQTGPGLRRRSWVRRGERAGRRVRTAPGGQMGGEKQPGAA